MLEAYTLLGALAARTSNVRLGTLVTGIHYRHPAILANMATTLDIISGGRLELGIGAGWNEEESGAYGIELGTPTQRSDRLEEACEVLIRLLTQETNLDAAIVAAPTLRAAVRGRDGIGKDHSRSSDGDFEWRLRAGGQFALTR